ncbi:MAG: glycosyltransferase 87 family protein [Anaerolineae bacterium]
MARLTTWVREHRDFVILACLFASFRWLVLLTYRPGGYILDFSDYYFYRALAQLSHRDLYPFVNLWAAYPPLFPLLMLGLYRLSALVPAWNGTGLWFYTLLGSVLLVFETGNLVLLYLLALRLGDGREALRTAWFYAGLFVPVYTLTGWFEAMPLFFFLLALYALVRGRYGWSGMATALGFLTKLIPVLLVPLALRALWERRRFRTMATYLGVMLGMILLGVLPFLATEPRLLLGPFLTQAHREPWESLWALWDGQFSYGMVHADIRNLSDIGGPPVPTRVPWGLVTAAFAVGFLYFYTRRVPWEEPRSQVAFAGLCTVGLLLYSKGYSPQFAVWVLPFAALLLPNLRGAAYAVLLALFNVVEANFYFIIFPMEHHLLAAVVLLRTLVFLLLGGEMALVLLPRWAARVGPWRRWAAVGAVALTLATGIGLAPGLARAYFRESLARNPCREAVAQLEGEAGAEDVVLFVRQETLDLFYPYLWRRVPMRVVDDYAGGKGLARHVEAQVRRWSQDRGVVWLVMGEGDGDSPVAKAAGAALESLAYPAEEAQAGACTLRRYLVPSALVPPEGPAQVGQVARLLGAHWQVHPGAGGGEVRLFLVWRAEGTSGVPLTVFTHLLSPEGRVVAGHDGPPAEGRAPTDGWAPGAVVVDPHRMAVPASLPPGTYTLEAGLYDPATGERLPVLDGEGRAVGDRIVVGTVRWP